MTAFAYRNVKVLSVHDGDTFTAEIPTGLHLHPRKTEIDRGLHLYVRTDGVEVWRWPVRLNGCNAPELATPQGPPAHDALTALLRTPIDTLATHLVQTEKYGRVLGDVTLTDGTNVTAALIASGHAQPWDGNGPRP